MSEQYPLALPVNTVLAGQYIIQGVLGQGGFGITYKAQDRMNGRTVAVKEFFPDSMATRVPGQTQITTYTGERGENFAYGKQCFLQEAETLAQFIGNENIVRIYSYFEEYGTAYFVMDFIEGTSLDEFVKQHGGKLTFDEAADILVPVMDALGAVHEKGIVHRDVSPDNIYITKDGTVKLIDFGAARQSLGDKSQSLDVILKHGFAPKEQYMRRGKQGPYTDIYALGATFYYVLTGKRPPDALERADEDEIIPPSALGVKLSKAEEEAILMALSVQPTDRFQSMQAFKNAMMAVKTETAEEPSSVPKTETSTENEHEKTIGPSVIETTNKNGKNNHKWIIAIAAVLVLVIAIFVVKNLPGKSNLLYPVIKGNNINNLKEGSFIDVSAKEPETIYRDPDNRAKVLQCISVINGKHYALDSSGKAVTFSVKDKEAVDKEEIPELSGFEGLYRLFVSDEYYFIYGEDRKVRSVNRKDGSVRETMKSDLEPKEFTFTETGKFCYMDWDGYEGHDLLYVFPAGSLDTVPDVYYTLPDTASRSYRRYIISGEGDIIYVYHYRPYYGVNKLYRFDLSNDKDREPRYINLPDGNPWDFTCDGKTVFYNKLTFDGENNNTIRMTDNGHLIFEDYRTVIGTIDPVTGSTKEMYDTVDLWGWTVYPDKKGTLTFFNGNRYSKPLADKMVTIP